MGEAERDGEGGEMGEAERWGEAWFEHNGTVLGSIVYATPLRGYSPPYCLAAIAASALSRPSN